MKIKATSARIVYQNLLKERDELKAKLKDLQANSDTNDRDANFWMNEYQKQKSFNAELIQALKGIINPSAKMPSIKEIQTLIEKA